MNTQPSPENELRSRILKHLNARPEQGKVVLCWSAYLAGLLEWGVIDGNAHSRLLSLLPKIQSKEIVEILLGVDYVSEHPEIFQLTSDANAER